MKSLLKLGIVLFGILMIFSTTGVQEVKAATSPLQFAVPVETTRYKYALAMIHADNTMELVNMAGEVKCAVVNPSGTKVAYSVREGDRLKVYTCDPKGQNKVLITDYRSDKRNMQDFIDLLFVDNGANLLMAKLIKNEIAFMQHEFKKGSTRFLNKSEWKGMPFVIHSLDPASKGVLVFKMDSRESGRTTQQIWTMSAHEAGSSLFLEIESPPSILNMVPDIKNKRIFAACTNTRNVAVKDQKKSMLIIDSVEDEPKSLDTGMIFDNITMSNDRNSVIWKSSSVGGSVQFKKYNMKTGEITVIPAAAEPEQNPTGLPVK